MDKDLLAVALSNLNWRQEIADCFVSKSGAVVIHLQEAQVNVRINGYLQAVAVYEECVFDRCRKVVSLGSVELGMQGVD